MAPLVEVLPSEYQHDGDEMHHHYDLIIEPTTPLLPKQLPNPAVKEVHHQQKQQKKKKRISFADFSEMYFVPNIEDMTQEERIATYMQDWDYDRIYQENMYKIEEMMKVSSANTATTTTTIYDDYQDHYRGLEIRLPQLKIQKIQRVAYFRQAVLRHQEAFGQIHSEWVESWLSPSVAPFAIAAQWRAALDCQSVFADDLRDTNDVMMQQQQQQQQQQHNVCCCCCFYG